MSMAASLPSVSGYSSTASSIYSKRNPTNILDRPLNKTRGAEVSVSAFAFLFSEMLQYTQKRVHGIQDLER
ncbi:TRAPP subunit trs31, partial [Modicella reniformis]